MADSDGALGVLVAIAVGMFCAQRFPFFAERLPYLSGQRRC